MKILAFVLGILWGIFSMVIVSITSMGSGMSWPILLTIDLPGGLSSITFSLLENIGLRLPDSFGFIFVFFYALVLTYIILFCLRKIFSSVK